MVSAIAKATNAPGTRKCRYHSVEPSSMKVAGTAQNTAARCSQSAKSSSPRCRRSVAYAADTSRLPPMTQTQPEPERPIPLSPHTSATWKMSRTAMPASGSTSREKRTFRRATSAAAAVASSTTSSSPRQGQNMKSG